MGGIFQPLKMDAFILKKRPLWALIPQWPNLYGVVTDQNVSICFSVGDSFNIVKPCRQRAGKSPEDFPTKPPASQRGMSSFRCLVPGAALQLPGANLKGDFQHLRLAQWNRWSLAYPEGHQWSWSFALQVPGWFNSYECSTMWMIKPIIFAHRWWDQPISCTSGDEPPFRSYLDVHEGPRA